MFDTQFLNEVWIIIDNARDHFVALIIWQVQQSIAFVFGNKAEQNKNQSMLVKELSNLTHNVQPTEEHSLLHSVLYS